MPNPTAPQTVDSRIRSRLQDYVTNEIERGIRRSFNAISDPAQFIASTESAPAHLEFSRSMTRRVCRAWARGSTPIQGPLADFTYGPICRPYLASISEEPGQPDAFPPFTGGQCVGTVYAVSGRFIPQGGNPNFPSFFGPANVNGRVTGVTPRPNFFNPAKVDIWITSSTGPDVRVVQDTFAGLTGLTITAVTRVSGNPDTCGSLPSDYLAPLTPTGLPPLDGTPIDLPGVGPTPISISFDNDGNIVISMPEFGLDFSVPNPLLSSEGEGDSLPPGEQGVAGIPDDSEDGLVEGENSDRNLVGIKVAITGFPPRANVNFNSQGAYYKGAYYAYMGGDGGLSQHPAAIVKPEQFFYADKGANRWRVEANLGYSVRVTPYFED